jgi:hypothetical protein
VEVGELVESLRATFCSRIATSACRSRSPSLSNVLVTISKKAYASLEGNVTSELRELGYVRKEERD